MAVTPTYSTRPSFLGTANQDRDAPFVCAGVPFDIGTTHRAGARYGPLAIRAISRMLVDGVNPMNWRNPQELPLADIGDFEIALGESLELAPDAEEAADEVLEMRGELEQQRRFILGRRRRGARGEQALPQLRRQMVQEAGVDAGESLAGIEVREGEAMGELKVRHVYSIRLWAPPGSGIARRW